MLSKNITNTKMTKNEYSSQFFKDNEFMGCEAEVSFWEERGKK